MNPAGESTSDDVPKLGDAVLERSVLNAVRSLWEGPILPKELPRIELGLRAIMTAERLFASQIELLLYDAREDGGYLTDPSLYEYVEPFGDGDLDYAFTIPTAPIRLAALSEHESSYLTSVLAVEVRRRALQLLPEQASTNSEVIQLLEREVGSLVVFDRGPAGMDEIPIVSWNEHAICNGAYDKNSFIKNQFETVLSYVRAAYARYFLRCHRAGMSVYASGITAEVCHDFIFSKWPQRLFEPFAEDYAIASRQVRGPGISVDLPPLMSLVLSRAKTRYAIPSTIREMRLEYERARSQLWKILNAAWNAPGFKDQLRILEQLESAAKAMFSAAFPERMNVLALALEVVTGEFADAGNRLLQADEPKARVSAVSFAKSLSQDFRKHLLNEKKSLKRHLSLAEQIEFGLR
jgi:hypothetical protein